MKESIKKSETELEKSITNKNYDNYNHVHNILKVFDTLLSERKRYYSQ